MEGDIKVPNVDIDIPKIEGYLPTVDLNIPKIQSDIKVPIVDINVPKINTIRVLSKNALIIVIIIDKINVVTILTTFII